MSTLANRTLGHVDLGLNAQFLQQTQNLEAWRHTSHVDFLQLRVKAKLDKLKEALEWEQYLKSATVTEETKNQTAPLQQQDWSGPISVNTGNDNIKKEDFWKSKTRRPAKFYEERNRIIRKNQQSVAVESSLRQLDKENTSVSVKSLPPKLRLQFQNVTKPTVNFNKTLFGSHFQEENVQTVCKQLAPNIPPRFKQEEYLTQIVRNSVEPVRRHFLHSQERRKLKNEAKSRLLSKNVPLHATKRMQTDCPKSALAKSVQFASDLKHVDKRQKHEATSTTTDVQNTFSENVRHLLRKWQEDSEKNIQAQMSELKNVRAELDKLQEQEDQIKRKWNQFYDSTTFKKDQNSRPEMFLYQPLLPSSSDHLHSRLPFAQAKPRVFELEGIADSLFDDVLHEIAEELSRISEDCVNKIYEEEFISPSFAEGFL